MPKKLEEALGAEDCEKTRGVVRLFGGKVVAILNRPVPCIHGVAFNREEFIFKPENQCGD